MIYMKSNEYNIINNYNDKVKMILRSRLEANIKYVVTTSYSAIKMGFLDKIEYKCDFDDASPWKTVVICPAGAEELSTDLVAKQTMQDRKNLQRNLQTSVNKFHTSPCLTDHSIHHLCHQTMKVMKLTVVKRHQAETGWMSGGRVSQQRNDREQHDTQNNAKKRKC